MKIFLKFFLIIFIFVSCSDDNSNSVVLPDENDTPILNQDNTNANIEQGKYAYRIEIPRITDDDIFISHCTTVNGKENITYSLAHNPERKHSRWTAFTFDASNRDIKWSRGNWDKTEWGGDPFQPDPELPEEYVFTREEIKRNGFQRGHIVASYDRVYSKDANEQTYYYSNMSPMISRFNTGIWLNLEGLVQNWGRNKSFCDTLYIVKGGTISEGMYYTKGTCPTVPKYYFMALLGLLPNNTYQAIGFWFEHKIYQNGELLKDYAMSIDELEEKCGIDFFCNLNDNLEKAVEKQYYINQWNGLQ